MYFDALKQVVNAIHPVGDDDFNAFCEIWEPFSAKRKEILTHCGDTERYLYFVTEGVQRVYYFDDDKREATLVFTYAPSFGGVIDSFMLQQPSKYYYETLAPSTFLRAPYRDVKYMMDTIPGIAAVVTQGLSASIAGVLERLVQLQCFSSEEKFRALMSRSPHILLLVPHKYLANYLGIDASNFSKLINRVII